MDRSQFISDVCRDELEQLEHLHSEDTPLPPHDYPYYWVILDPKSKEDSQHYKFKEFAKISIFLKQTLHVTHLLKLLDKMCKYEMDPMSIVEERTRFCPQMTDGRTNKVKPVYPPFNFVEAGGMIKKINVKAVNGDMGNNESVYHCVYFLYPRLYCVVNLI